MTTESLKALMKRIPDTEGFDEIVIELKTGGPHAVAVLGGTLVESYLEDFLRGKMRKDLTNIEANEIFGINGPLSSFSAKINVGYAFSCYGPETRQNMHWIREIRNAFAHPKTMFSFDTEAVRHTVARLIPRAKPDPEVKTTQDAFVRGALLVTAHLAILAWDGTKTHYLD